MFTVGIGSCVWRILSPPTVPVLCFSPHPQSLEPLLICKISILCFLYPSFILLFVFYFAFEFCTPICSQAIINFFIVSNDLFKILESLDF